MNEWKQVFCTIEEVAARCNALEADNFTVDQILSFTVDQILSSPITGQPGRLVILAKRPTV